MLQVKIGDRVHVKTHNWKNGRPAGAGEPIFGEVVGLVNIDQAPGYQPYAGPQAVVYPLGGARVLSPQGRGEIQSMYILVPVVDWALEVLDLDWKPVWGPAPNCEEVPVMSAEDAFSSTRKACWTALARMEAK